MKDYILKKICLFLITIFLFASVITSCGGGGGGGGAVSFQNSSQLHNGGGNSGWGTGNQTGNGFNPEGQSIEEAEAGLLISQMAALSGITVITIELTINGTPYPAINADETTTTAVLPKIKAGDKISGKATINLSNGDPRVAYLDETEAALHGVLKFKVPYNYTACDFSGATVSSGTYFARDGINLAAQTVDPIAGWQCVEDGTTHYGSYVTGVRGDITLNAVSASGAPVLSATASPENLYATATSGDTTTITITGVTGSPQVSSISNELEQQGTIVPDNASNPTSYTLTVKIKDDPTGNPVWFNDDTTANVTITDDSGAIKSVPLTLKNKYTFTVADASNISYPQGDKDQGTSYSFDDLKGIIPSSAIPAGREIIEFEMSGTTYKPNQFPITLSSSSFSQRLIRFKAVLDFGMTITGGKGDGATHAGTEADPYVLKYNAIGETDETKITVNVTGNKGSVIARSPSGIAALTISHPQSTTTTQNIKIEKTILAASAIPNEGLKIQITVRDYQSGVPGAADNDDYLYSKKTFWLIIPKPTLIGTKDVPNQLGDIVFTDGSACSYNSSLNSAQLGAAVAVIFDASAKKGVALQESPSALAWDPNYGIFDNGAPLYNTSDDDGSGNWAVIQQAEPTRSTNAATNFPAFNYANNYSTTGCTSGWYLPAKNELLAIINNVSTINTALTNAGGSNIQIANGCFYWSSSSVDNGSGVGYTYGIGYNNSGVLTADKGFRSPPVFVRAVHKFN